MAKKKDYCTQNKGDCASCSLSSYGLDCMNVPLKGQAKPKGKPKGGRK